MQNAEKGLFVGLIPDGNRRWEKQNHQVPGMGHREGAERVKEIISAFRDNAYTNILAVWGLSCKNLDERDASEQELLFLLMEEFLTDLRDNWMDKEENKQVRLAHLGRTDRMAEHAYGKQVVHVLDDIATHTRDRTGKAVAFCLDYDAKDERTRAKNLWRAAGRRGEFEEYLDLPRQEIEAGSLNLIIRTGSDPVVIHDNEFLKDYRDETRQIHHPYYMPDYSAESFHQDIQEYLEVPKRKGK